MSFIFGWGSRLSLSELYTLEANFKKERTVNDKHINEIRKLNCMACGKTGPSEAHHIKTKGSGGGDDYWNVLSLCCTCHTLGGHSWHQAGWVSFLEMFPHVWDHMKELEWEIILGRLKHPGYLEG